MAIHGIDLDRNNPKFYRRDFEFWMPQFKNYINTDDGIYAFDKLKKIANQRIYHSIFGVDWEYAMSLCIAHYLQLKGERERAHSGSTLEESLAGGTHKGILQSASIGGFSKSIDFDKSLIDSDETKFWNQTAYGTELMTLYKTKAVPSIFVVTMEGT